jgi:hypothetical protein
MAQFSERLKRKLVYLLCSRITTVYSRHFCATLEYCNAIYGTNMRDSIRHGQGTAATSVTQPATYHSIITSWLHTPFKIALKHVANFCLCMTVARKMTILSLLIVVFQLMVLCTVRINVFCENVQITPSNDLWRYAKNGRPDYSQLLPAYTFNPVPKNIKTMWSVARNISFAIPS